MNKTDSVLKSLMADFQLDVPLEEFKMGIKVEKEHTESGPRKGMYAVIPNKLLFIARIAAAHLAELPDYYTRLKKMEEQGKKEASSIQTKLKRLYDRQVDSTDPEAPSYEEWYSKIGSGDVVNENGSTHEEVLHRTGKPFEDSRLDKLRGQMADSLHYLHNKMIPESKGNPRIFRPLRELKDTLETSILTLDETLLALKND